MISAEGREYKFIFIFTDCCIGSWLCFYLQPVEVFCKFYHIYLFSNHDVDNMRFNKMIKLCDVYDNNNWALLAYQGRATHWQRSLDLLYISERLPLYIRPFVFITLIWFWQRRCIRCIYMIAIAIAVIRKTGTWMLGWKEGISPGFVCLPPLLIAPSYDHIHMILSIVF